MDRYSTVPSALPAPSSPPYVKLCNQRKGESSLTQTSTATHTLRGLLIYDMCRHWACTNSAFTTHTSASTLRRHNLAAFCEMGSLWRQMGEACNWIQRRWTGSKLPVYVSHCSLWVCVCMLTPVCSDLRFHSPSSFIQPLQRKWRGILATHAFPLWNLKWCSEWTKNQS